MVYKWFYNKRTREFSAYVPGEVIWLEKKSDADDLVFFNEGDEVSFTTA